MLAVHPMPCTFSVAECESIIAAAVQAPNDEALLVGQNKVHALRKARLVWLDDITGLEWVMDRLIALIRKSYGDQFDFDLREFAESSQVAIYRSSDAGHFAWHSDIGGGPTSRKRKLTLVLQLSNADAYEGSDLKFMPGAQVQTASRVQGGVSVFPSFTLHQVTPVQHGVRYSMTVRAHGQSFR